MARSEDAAERGRRLREALETEPASPQPAKVIKSDPPETDWTYIPAQQILVVEYEGKQRAAVSVDTEDGRALYSQETSPCPTCHQEWTRGDRLDGEVKVVWPEHYKN